VTGNVIGAMLTSHIYGLILATIVYHQYLDLIHSGDLSRNTVQD
jgi:hypothetical protein